MKLSTALKLGRVSNLPTVWSNVLAGAVLSGGELQLVPLLLLGAGMSGFYVAGMFLNDYHDRRIDALERPERPIPSGEVSAAEVHRTGSALLVFSTVWVTFAAALAAAGPRPILAALALATCIILYDRNHKRSRSSPILMALCRVAVLLGAASCFAPTFGSLVLLAALSLFAHVVGLTFAARSENQSRLSDVWPLLLLCVPFACGFALLDRVDSSLVFYILTAIWVGDAIARLRPRFGRPDIRRGVLHLIAAIPLLDTFFITCAGEDQLALLALSAYFATLFLHRYVAGT